MSKRILLFMPRTGPFFIEPPFGVLSLSAGLKKAGFDPVVWDARFDDYKDIFDRYDKKEIVACGLSVMTGPQIHFALKISRFIKKHSHIPVIWGGIHPTLLPVQTLADPNIDYVVMGYGEITLPLLVKAIIENRIPPLVPNVAYKRAGEVVVNERDDEANGAPMAYDWDAIDISRYLRSDSRIGKKVLSMFTSNGCPHSCTFCYGREFHSKKWRAQSSAEVMDEVDALRARCDFDAVHFRDDNFLVDRKRALSIAAGMKERGIPFALSIRADYADDTLIGALKECGCAQVEWGTESGSQRILDSYKKGITIQDILKTAALTAKHGIGAYTSIMMGHYDETPEELAMTMDLIDRMIGINSRLTITDIRIPTPYHGSELYQEAVRRGYKLPGSLIEWNRYNWNTANQMPGGNRRFLNIITIVSLFSFCDWRIRKKNKLYNYLVSVLHRVSVLRWKKRYFKYPLEICLCRAVLYVMNRW